MFALEQQITMLKDFRADRWAKIRAKLKPVVEVILRLTDVVGESAESIVPICLFSPLRIYNSASHRVFLGEKARSPLSVSC